jgi:hypothetical protein
MFASSGHHGPSTRRPARGAGSCEHPATTNGPWILSATILGSSMAFIDGSVVNVALPAFTVGPACNSALSTPTRSAILLFR